MKSNIERGKEKERESKARARERGIETERPTNGYTESGRKAAENRIKKSSILMTATTYN